MKNRTKLLKVLYFAFAILFGLGALSFIIINQSDDFSESESQSKATIEISKNQTVYDKSHAILPKKLHAKETLQSAEKRKDLNMLEKENPSHPSKLEGYVKTDSIVEGVGLPEDELKALHTSQNQEIERMFMDIDSIVIDPSEEGTAGITLGQLLALHKQQENEIEKSDDWDKIVIPASEDGSPGLSRAELSALHEQQEHEIANADDWDKIVIPASEDGSPGLSLEELTALQKQQDYETGESSEDPFAPLAPSPSEGGPDMTAHELNELHNNQTLD